MTKKQANNLMSDLRKELTSTDFCETLYVSINGIGTKIFKECAYHECDGYTFIWTSDESFLIDKKDCGDFIVVPQSKENFITI